MCVLSYASRVHFFQYNKKKMVLWTEEAEEMLHRWGEQAQYDKLLYEQAAQAARSRDQWFGIPLVVLGCIVTSSVFMQLTTCEFYQHMISGGLALLFTILTAIGKVIGLNQEHSNFIETAKSYDDVVMDIQEQLSRPHTHRLPCSDFVATIKTALQKLKRAPSVPSSVFRSYLKDVDRHLSSLGIQLTQRDDQLLRKLPTEQRVTVMTPDSLLASVVLTEPEQPILTTIRGDEDVDSRASLLYAALATRKLAYTSYQYA